MSTHLKTLNSRRQIRETEFDTMLLREIYGVGRLGKSARDAHGHLLFIEQVIRPVDPSLEPSVLSGWHSGDLFTVRAACNGNGEKPGTVEPDWDLDNITCSKCLKVLERIEAAQKRKRT